MAFSFWGLQLSASAELSPTEDGKKMRIVSALYQATYGAQERCRLSNVASAGLEKSIDQLRRVYPELLALLDSSPYLTQVQEQFTTILRNAPEVSGGELEQECEGIKFLLDQLVESSGGRAAASDMIATLKKY
jgi:hypothetical protein